MVRFAGLWICPTCNMPWRSRPSILELVIQGRAVIANGQWRIAVLCTACNHLSDCSNKDFQSRDIPDNELPMPPNRARRIFSASALCDDKNCGTPRIIYALSNGFLRVHDIKRIMERATLTGPLQCQGGHPIIQPLTVRNEKLFYKERSGPK